MKQKDVLKQQNNSTMAAKDIEKHKFKPGKTGNPNGRPKKLPQLDKLLANVLGDKKDGITAAEAILKKLRQMAAMGNIRAAEILLDRGYGKPKQFIESNITQRTVIIDTTGDPDTTIHPEAGGGQEDI